MSDNIKIIIVMAATLAFFIGAFVMGSKLFGPERPKKRRIKKQPEYTPAVQALPAVPAVQPAEALQSSDYSSLPQMQGGMNITPNPIPFAPAPQICAGMQTPATEFHPIVPMDFGMNGRAQSAQRTVMRITILNDNGAPAYPVEIREGDFPVHIGRGACDDGGRSIVVGEPTVSVKHVKLLNNNGMITVCDCCSTCGTVINGSGGSVMMKNPNQMTVTAVQDERFELGLGRMIARVEMLAPLSGQSAPGCRIVLTAEHSSLGMRQASFTGSFSIGRQNADFLLPDPTVSGRHAEAALTPDGRFVLTDCNSTNGTYDAVSGNRITTIELKQGMVLNLGDTRLTVNSIEFGAAAGQSPYPPKTVFFDSTRMGYIPCS